MAGNITAAQLRAARALVRADQKEIADEAGVSVPTLKRLEGSEGLLSGHFDTITGLMRAYEQRGVEFIPENGGGAGVRFRERS